MIKYIIRAKISFLCGYPPVRIEKYTPYFLSKETLHQYLNEKYSEKRELKILDFENSSIHLKLK